MKPVEIWLVQRFANFSPVTHTNLHSSCITFFHDARTKRKRQKSKKERKRENGRFGGFFFSGCQKASFLRSFVQRLSKPIRPRALCTSCVRKRIFRSYPRDAESSLNPLSVFHVVKPESFGLRIPLFTCPYVQSL